MEGITAQLPALLGVLVGTIGTIVATSLADRSRWRRNQTVRWDERRLDAYVEFARALKEAHTIASRATGGYLDRDVALAELAEADFRHTLAWENVLLLGDAPTVTAARAWRDRSGRSNDWPGRSTPTSTGCPPCCTGQQGTRRLLPRRPWWTRRRRRLGGPGRPPGEQTQPRHSPRPARRPR